MEIRSQDEFELVVIENVSPQVDGGLFPVKAVPGETIHVTADIFSYSKIFVAARILYKSESDRTWRETFMKSVGNDRWQGYFVVENAGGYTYKIRAWADYASTWRNAFADKLQAYESFTQLVPEGKAILQRMHKQATQDDKALIAEALRMFGDERRHQETGQLVMSYRFTEWLHRYPVQQGKAETSPVAIRVYNPKVVFSSWYTLYPRSASPVAGEHGTLRDVAGILPRIAHMGFDVLHLPPVHPIGETHRRGRNGNKTAAKNAAGSVYAIGSGEEGHEAIHPELGSVEDLRNLIFEADSQGIEIAMDLALVFSPDHPWVAAHTDWFDSAYLQSLSSDGAASDTSAESTPLIVNAANWEETKQAVAALIALWADWGIRIIRVNNPDSQPQLWWSEVIRLCESVYPDLLFYAGTFTRPKIMQFFAKSGFALSDSYFMWKNTKYELEQYVEELKGQELRDFYKPVFWTNTHQVNPYNLQSGHEPQHLIRFFLAATLSACYGMYGPVFEQVVHEPFPGKEDYWDSERYEIKNWDWEKETKITYLIGMLNRLRKENAALQQTKNVLFFETTNGELLGYLKTCGLNHILSVVNLDAHNRQAGMIRVDTGLIGKGNNEPYIAHDLITGARYVWHGEWNYIELDPFIMPFHLVRIEDYRPELDSR